MKISSLLTSLISLYPITAVCLARGVGDHNLECVPDIIAATLVGKEILFGNLSVTVLHSVPFRGSFLLLVWPRTTNSGVHGLWSRQSS